MLSMGYKVLLRLRYVVLLLPGDSLQSVLYSFNTAKSLNPFVYQRFGERTLIFLLIYIFRTKGQRPDVNECFLFCNTNKVSQFNISTRQHTAPFAGDNIN